MLSEPPVNTSETLRYVSTRGEAPACSFEEALLAGLAPDGGLFVPTTIPQLDPADWQRATSFPSMATQVLGRWLHAEVPPKVLAPLLADALSFPVPLVRLGGAWEGVSVLELFHGPTLSFKDFGARTMARLMAHFLRERARPLKILVATSGDTGSAVADGFAGQAGIEVVLLYPRGQVSPVQERQLIVRRPGVRTFAVEGTFDDCQRLVKAAFQDDALRGLSSANSINIGRLLPQMLYYIWAMHLHGADGLTVCVPSGNLGNLTAGVLAALGGLPVRRFVAAHNANDFFPRYLAGNQAEFGASVRTLSNAMDVGAPSNFERLRHLLTPEAIRQKILGARIDDAETIRAMRRVYEETGYRADPHTAVGLEAVWNLQAQGQLNAPAVVLATAHPAKFPETAERALGHTPETPPRLAALWDRETAVTSLPPTLDALKPHLK